MSRSETIGESKSIDRVSSERDAMLRTLRSLREEPGAKEKAVLKEQEIAKTDPEVRDFVDLLHFDADRAASLERFMAGGFAQDVLAAIRHHYGERKNLAICEIGGGNGFLAAALFRAGYTDVDILEPADEHVTGTGFLRTVEEFSGLGMFNDLDEWYRDPKIYDLIITNRCIHHFENPVVAAAQIRLKVRDRALWLAFAEFFSADYEETLSQLNRHRHAILYSLYEWPYSAGLYTQMLKAGGFQRAGISAAVPYGRRPLSPALWAWRTIWRFIIELKLDSLAYYTFVLLVKLLSRKLLMRTGAHYMAFRARPVRWAHVDQGYNHAGGADLGMLPGWRPVAADPSPGT